MAKWNFFGGRREKPKKSLSQLQKEVDDLKKAKEKVQSYEELQKEKQRIQQEIRAEGFKLKHRRALNIINRGISIGESTYKQATSKKAKRFYKKVLK